jgi:hypothetical protein
MENIEEYIEITGLYLDHMPEMKFEAQINQSMTSLEQPLPTLSQQMNYWMRTIRTERKVLEFDMKETTKKILATITLEDLREIYKEVREQCLKGNFHFMS